MKREARKRKSYERCILVQSSLYFSFFYRLDKKRKKSLPVTTPHSLFQTLVRSLSLSFRSGNVLHLNDAMLVPKVSLSKNGIGWTTL